jgi:hypothetical protein
MGGSLRQFYDVRGNQMEPTSAYTPEATGIAERQSLRVLDMARPMLVDSGDARHGLAPLGASWGPLCGGCDIVCEGFARCERRERSWDAHLVRASWGMLWSWGCSEGLAAESGCTPQANHLCSALKSLHVCGQAGSWGSNYQWGPASARFCWTVGR